MALRLFPCDSEKCRDVGRPGYATLPDGSPYTLGRAPGPSGISAKCARCRRKRTLTALEYNRLPTITLDEARDLGVDGLLTGDLLGAGLQMEHIEQLEAAGVDLLHPALHPTPEQRGVREEGS